MRFADMNWMMLADYLKRDDRVMVVLGMTEQHSHLSLQTDSLIPGKLADAASQQTGVVVAPTLHFGVSPSFIAYPGTLSLKIQTYLKVVEELTQDLYKYGFRRILFLNGHGGNAPARTQLSELANELTDLQMLWYQWWTSSTVVEFSKIHNLPNQHANWEENFPFTRVNGDSPNGEKPIVSYGERIINSGEMRVLAQDGSFGGPWQVGDDLMKTMFELCLQDVVRLLAFDQH
ncbi:MAG TPA: creatininase family protein [Anaerolineaceae bacterium]|nr:creatininase family protein [Anaerolineaceae bacterium]